MESNSIRERKNAWYILCTDGFWMYSKVHVGLRHSTYHFQRRIYWSSLTSILKHSPHAYNRVQHVPHYPLPFNAVTRIFSLMLSKDPYFLSVQSQAVHHLWLSLVTEVTVSLDNKVTMATVMTKMRQGSSGFPVDSMGGCGVASVGGRVVIPCFLKNASGPKLKTKIILLDDISHRPYFISFLKWTPSPNEVLRIPG